MFEGLPVSLLDGLGTVGVVVVIGLLIATGKWVPRKTYDDKCHEADEWRTEARIKDQQIHELVEQNTALLREFGPLLTDFLHDLRAAADIPNHREDAS